MKTLSNNTNSHKYLCVSKLKEFFIRNKKTKTKNRPPKLIMILIRFSCYIHMYMYNAHVYMYVQYRTKHKHTLSTFFLNANFLRKQSYSIFFLNEFRI